MSESLLPAAFSDLEPFAERWCLATETERYARRMESSMDEMQRFYDAIFPRMDDAIAYCDQFALDAMPDDAVRLLHLMHSLVAVSFPVEVWHDARIPDVGDAKLERVVEPAP